MVNKQTNNDKRLGKFVCYRVKNFTKSGNQIKLSGNSDVSELLFPSAGRKNRILSDDVACVIFAICFGKNRK